jgi:CRP-like cAMP-binding protein/tetratricopeptide (TPR) repeat protein
VSDQPAIKKFKNADVIFSEGEASGSAFVIVKGGVELTKNSKRGAVRLATLKAGELFGEMGVIDGSPRSATAKAIGPTTVKEISPQALMNGIQNDPDLSSKVMGKLVERLRAADEMLAKAGVSAGNVPSTASMGAAQAKKKGFFSRLFGAEKGRSAPFEILIADFLDDESGFTQKLYNSLKRAAENVGGTLVHVRKADAPFAVTDFNDNPVLWGQSKTAAQKWLREQDADLLIWGQVRPQRGIAHLRFNQVQPLRHERAGSVHSWDGVDIPLEFDEPMTGYLYATAIAALVPHKRAQADCFDALLGPALDLAAPIIQKRQSDLDGDGTARFYAGFANIAATCGVYLKQDSHFKLAEETYLKAIRSLRRSQAPLLEGLIKRHLGYAQSGWFDAGGDRDLLGAAIETFREACDFFTKESYPVEWAELQSMIGQLLYKKDGVDDDDRALNESIAAFQSALQVFSASTTPNRWGDAKHHLARTLQLLGSQTGNLDMIARSAEACREALAVRNKAQTPMLWAATQNNLGSALFMLCQKTRKPETAEAAVKAFQSALDVYLARKATKLAQVTQKNLSRAQEVAIDLGPISDEADDFYEGFDDLGDENLNDINRD